MVMTVIMVTDGNDDDADDDDGVGNEDDQAYDGVGNGGANLANLDRFKLRLDLRQLLKAHHILFRIRHGYK